MTTEILPTPSKLTRELAGAPQQRGLLKTLRWGWQYRHLLRNLVVRDLKVRYRGSALGFGWTFLSPLLMTLIFTYVLGDVFKVPDLGVPYPAFFLVGMLAWNFCAMSVVGSLWSIVGNASIASKVYFPRSILPISVVIAAAVNFVLAMAVSMPIIYSLGVQPTWSVLLAPVIVIEQVVLLIGIALILAALNVLYRDTAPTVEVLLQAWFFLTPVIYDIGALSQGASADVEAILLALNPMAAIVTMYRTVLLHGTAPDAALLLRTLLINVAVCLVGIVVFTRNSDRIGDDL
jgi:ABC-type polysaccharide/polyol phosphate export permease